MYSRIRLLLHSVVAMGAVVSACSVDHVEVPPEELYAREFIKQIGIIDSKHDCNMSRRGTVTVKTQKPADLKILADVAGKRYLFADYKNVSGSQIVSFDIPSDIKDVIVRANGKEHVARLGSTINLDNVSSRTINSNPDGTPVAYYPGEARDILGSISARFTSQMPQNTYNNYRNAVSDFSLISEKDKEMVIYPISARNKYRYIFDNYEYYSHCLGIYWLDPADGGKLRKENMRDLYYGYTNELSYTVTDESGNVSEKPNTPLVIPALGEYTEEEIAHWDAYTIKTHAIKYKFNEDGIKYGFYVKFKRVTGAGLASFLDPGNETLPINFEYIHFSQAFLNEVYGTQNGILNESGSPDYLVDVVYKDDNGKTNGTGSSPNRQSLVYRNTWDKVSSNYTHVAAAFKPVEYPDGTTRLFFSFEDGQNEAYFDLCDLIFMFDESTTPVVYDEIADEKVDLPVQSQEPEYEPYEWLIAAEDLGGTNDFDFNDLVVSVKYNSVKDGTAPEYTDVTITPLASGGTIPIYLMYDGRIGSDVTESTYVIGEECHLWLGGADSTTPLNVHSAITHVCPESKAVTISVPGQFSLASHGNNSTWGVNGSDNMGGFWLLVDPDQQFSGASHPYNAVQEFPSSSHKVQPPMEGADFTAPQMICVGNAWEWPTEKSSIQTTYLNFTGWLNGDTDMWYGTTAHHNGNVIKRD